MTKPLPADLLYSVDSLLNLQAVKMSDTQWHLYEAGACSEDFDDRMIVSKCKYGKSWIAGGFRSDQTWTLEDEFAVQWLLAHAAEVATIADLVTLLGPCDEAVEDQRANLMSELSERTAEYRRNNASVFGSK